MDSRGGGSRCIIYDDDDHGVSGSDCDPDRKMGAVDADRSMEIQKCYR